MLAAKNPILAAFKNFTSELFETLLATLKEVVTWCWNWTNSKCNPNTLRYGWSWSNIWKPCFLFQCCNFSSIQHEHLQLYLAGECRSVSSNQPVQLKVYHLGWNEVKLWTALGFYNKLQHSFPCGKKKMNTNFNNQALIRKSRVSLTYRTLSTPWFLYSPLCFLAQGAEVAKGVFFLHLAVTLNTKKRKIVEASNCI